MKSALHYIHIIGFVSVFQDATDEAVFVQQALTFQNFVIPSSTLSKRYEIQRLEIVW